MSLQKKKHYTQFASSMRRVMGVQRACHGGEKKICLNLMAGTSYGKKKPKSCCRMSRHGKKKRYTQSPTTM